MIFLTHWNQKDDRGNSSPVYRTTVQALDQLIGMLLRRQGENTTMLFTKPSLEDHVQTEVKVVTITKV